MCKIVYTFFRKTRFFANSHFFAKHVFSQNILKMDSVTGKVTSRVDSGTGSANKSKLTVDFDKIGAVDKRPTNVYKMQVNEKSTLKFALKGVKATRVDLIVDSLLMSVISPEYDEDWCEDDVTIIWFFGEGIYFHRGLIDVPVEIVVTTDDEKLPNIMIGIITPTKTWETISDEVYTEVVTANSQNGKQSLKLLYHRAGCGFLPL